MTETRHHPRCPGGDRCTLTVARGTASSPASVARWLGWGPGTEIEGFEGEYRAHCRIEYVGDRILVMRRLDRKEPWYPENAWTLSSRCWVRVSQPGLIARLLRAWRNL